LDLVVLSKFRSIGNVYRDSLKYFILLIP
jgi:hypothetical protein